MQAFIQENWLLILVAFASGAMLVWPLVQRRLSPVKALGTTEVIRLINSRNAVPLDVRDAKAFDEGHILNAVSVPLSDIGSKQGELAKHAAAPVVAYCDNGSRNHVAAAALAKAGLTEVYLLNGGFRAWRDAGLPVEKSR